MLDIRWGSQWKAERVPEREREVVSNVKSESESQGCSSTGVNDCIRNGAPVIVSFILRWGDNRKREREALPAS